MKKLFVAVLAMLMAVAVSAELIPPNPIATIGILATNAVVKTGATMTGNLTAPSVIANEIKGTGVVECGEASVQGGMLSIADQMLTNGWFNIVVTDNVVTVSAQGGLSDTMPLTSDLDAYVEVAGDTMTGGLVTPSVTGLTTLQVTNKYGTNVTFTAVHGPSASFGAGLLVDKPIAAPGLMIRSNPEVMVGDNTDYAYIGTDLRVYGTSTAYNVSTHYGIVEMYTNLDMRSFPILNTYQVKGGYHLTNDCIIDITSQYTAHIVTNNIENLFLCPFVSNLEVIDGGAVRYTGVVDRAVQAVLNASIRGGNSDRVGICFGRNGVPSYGTKDTVEMNTTAQSKAVGTTCTGIMTNGMIWNVFVINESGTTDITLFDMHVTFSD